MEEKFTVAEFKKYVESQDSLGEVMYNLNATNIKAANSNNDVDEEDEFDVNDILDDEDDDY